MFLNRTTEVWVNQNYAQNAFNYTDNAKHQPTHPGPFLLHVKSLNMNINIEAISWYRLNTVSEASGKLHQTKCCRQIKIKHLKCLCPVSVLASRGGKLQISSALQLMCGKLPVCQSYIWLRLIQANTTTINPAFVKVLMSRVAFWKPELIEL